MSEWRDLVSKTFRELKQKDREASFGDALKQASKDWKKKSQSGGKKSKKSRGKKARKSRKSRK
jgi:flagellar hook-basal body complex protein FliE